MSLAYLAVIVLVVLIILVYFSLATVTIDWNTIEKIVYCHTIGVVLKSDC